MPTCFSVRDVTALWAFWEIDTPLIRDMYNDCHGINALRERKASGVPFDKLSAEERYSLAFAVALKRLVLFFHFAGVDHFELRSLNRKSIGRLLIHSGAWDGERWTTFDDYISTTPVDPSDKRDARRIMLDDPAHPYRPSEKPIIIGKSHHGDVLVDGFHRAAAFWRFGDESDTLSALLPII